MARSFLLVLVLGGLVFFSGRWRAHSRAPWTPIAPGVEMRTFHAGQGGVPSQSGVAVVALRTAPARVHVATGASLNAEEWRHRTAALAAVNGGFFDEAGRSLGLRIARGRRITRLHGTNWGVFSVRNGRAAIVRTRDFKMRSGIREAVQCGPLLVLAGRRMDLKPQWARRTGIGIQRDGRVIVAVTDGSLSFKDWAALWAARDGLNCRDALNLDGGSSTQLALKTRERSLDISAGREVPDAVIIK